MGQVRMKDACQQRCVKLLEQLNGKYSTWELWNDFITMTACAYANVAPNPKREEREKMYLQIAAKYTAGELDTFAEILAEVVKGMEADPAQDFLGELFMQLGLGSKWHGAWAIFHTVPCVRVDVKDNIGRPTGRGQGARIYRRE